MRAWEEYAYIYDNKVQGVATFQINSGAYTLANTIVKDLYGQEAFAVDVTQIPVQAGDEFRDG